ncbi:MAG: hypothetical protein Kow00121_51080 [Elainellaceae cyanobacterium]
MTYERRITRWVVVRLSSNLQRQDMARFHKYSDAEGYARTLQRLDSANHYQVVFDTEEQE